MKIVTPDTPACQFRILDGNVQEFVLTEVSRRSVDDLFDMTEEMLRGAGDDASDQVYPVLIDSSIGLQPLNHSFARLRGMMGKFPERRKGLIAIIMPASPLVRTISMMMRPIAPIRVYMPQERDQALTWLRASLEAKH